VRYTAIFGGLHFAFSIALGWALQIASDSFGKTRQSGSVGFFVNLVIASTVAWIFVRRSRRDFDKQERMYLFAGCLLYLLSFDAFILWTNPQYQVASSISSWAILIGVTVGLEAISLWIAFRFVITGMIKSYLERNPQATPNKSLERTREG